MPWPALWMFRRGTARRDMLLLAAGLTEAPRGLLFTSHNVEVVWYDRTPIASTHARDIGPLATRLGSGTMSR